MFYSYLADFVATIHTAYVAFVVFGLFAVYVGRWAGWGWVHNRWFRGIHLVMIVGVVLRATVVDLCPLSTWEYDLLEMAKQAGQERTWFGGLMHDLIHPDPEAVPLWVYFPLYTAFGALVIATLWVVPVHWRRRPAEAQPAAA